MASTYTDNVRLTKQGIGDNENQWGTILNTVLDLVDDSVTGRQTVNISTGSDITLTTNNGASDEARNMCLYLSGTPTADINVIIPAVPKMYVVELNISGSYTVTVKTSSGTGIAFKTNPVASTHMVWCNGTNVKEISEPQGKIGLFSGAVADIPAGYVLCNGTNNTPDLRDKFVIGAGSTYNPDATGGSLSALTTSTVGNHSHGGNTASHVLTVAEIPSHTHGIHGWGGSASTGEYVRATSPDATERVLNNTQATGSGGGHSHGISSDGSHSHTVTPSLPPYYALAYIMRV
jgi:microcystin-dependent protein